MEIAKVSFKEKGDVKRAFEDVLGTREGGAAYRQWLANSNNDDFKGV